MLSMVNVCYATVLMEGEVCVFHPADTPRNGYIPKTK